MSKPTVIVNDSIYTFDEGLNTEIGYISEEILKLIFPNASKLQQTCIGLLLCLPNNKDRHIAVINKFIFSHYNPSMLINSINKAYAETNYFSESFIILCERNEIPITIKPQNFLNVSSREFRNNVILQLFKLYNEEKLLSYEPELGKKQTVIAFLIKVRLKTLNKLDKEAIARIIKVLENIDEELL